MYPVGYLTVVIYLVSYVIFMYAAYYPRFFILGSIIGAILFVIASGMVGMMLRAEKKNEFRN
ncbi:MAG: hypothetical protein K1X72_10290 [Pyrinomonadaceae bacterium]|nr:hypothetical protein [Pyrinomonadaceae bacterium]